MNLISVKRQEIQFGPKGNPIRIKKGVVIKPVEEGVAVMQPLVGSAFKRTTLPPHYIFDGDLFRTVKTAIEEKAKEEKKKKIAENRPVYCQYGCGNQARYPEDDPVRCERYVQQCPVKREQASIAQKRARLMKKGEHKVEVVQPKNGFAEISDNATVD